MSWDLVLLMVLLLMVVSATVWSVIRVMKRGGRYPPYFNTCMTDEYPVRKA